MDFAIPLFFIALFFVGIPLGYKLVLGGRLTTVTAGVIAKLHLAHPIPDTNLEGRHARIVADYLILDIDGDRKLWISEVNVAGVEFKPED